jgi:hypothetical protein
MSTNPINGTDAADTITFTDTSTTVNAHEGANTVTGTTGNNVINSGDGADTITVTSGNNTINAGGGANTIVATSGINVINTGDGADTITTGGLTDGGNIIDAGDGANTITTGAGNDTITGGNGADTITTGAGDDVVHAGNGANTVTTGAGNDTVYTGVDIDTVTTGAGNDTIHISGGTDTITAGAGNDTLIADFSLATGAVSINTLAGNATAGYAGNISGLGIATFAGVENFEITSGSSNDTITTGDGNDVVHAGAGNDIVNLGGGDDEAIYTMAANVDASDVYKGGDGVDTLTLEFTDDEWQSSAVKTDIANYQAHLVNHSSDPFVFASGLTVSEFENLSVRIGDGNAEDMTVAQGGPPATFGFVFKGINDWDQSGFSVSSAGDVNGDGIDDILIGAPNADRDGVSTDGETYVVFGKDTAFDAGIDLADLDGSDGFVLNGIDVYAESMSASSAGDVNGDEIDDILIGIKTANSYAGGTYVVFGKDTSKDGNFAATIDLANLKGNNGFVLNGIDSFDSSGEVSSAGDVNGDGIDDILIGAANARHLWMGRGSSSAGETYVVFGKNTAETGDFDASIDLSSLMNGVNGFMLNGITGADRSGMSVSSAGDVNDDGIDDILIGAPYAEPLGGTYWLDPGETYVVFGKNTFEDGDFAAAIDLADLNGKNGFVLNGINVGNRYTHGDQSGYSVSSAGDVNGDGIDDILIGANGADPNGANNAGETYVVFGKNTFEDGDFAAAIDLADLNGENGFVLKGIHDGDQSGSLVSSAGDVNGDGTDDILIGVKDANNAGETYIVFGKDTLKDGKFAAAIDLAEINGFDGFVFKGINDGDRSGTSVSSAGDVNGDDYDDILIGATGAYNAGETYVVFGGPGMLAAYDLADGVADGSIELDLIGENPLAFI